MSKFQIIKFLIFILPFLAFADDNILCSSNSSISLMSLDAYSITSGQKWGGFVNQSNGCINVIAGRSNNSSNINNFVKPYITQTLGLPWAGYSTVTGRGYNSTPDKLNFAVRGTLVISQYNKDLQKTTSYTCANFMTGQGYTTAKGIYNNWWAFMNYNPGPDPKQPNKAYQQTIQCLDYSSKPVIFKMDFNNSSANIKFSLVN